MAFSHLGRLAIVGAAVFSFVGFVVACDDNGDDGWGDDGSGHHHRGGQQQCSNVVQQCQTVCQDQCDSFSCEPQCGQQCVNVCGDDLDASTLTADGSGDLVGTDGGTVTTVADAALPVIGDAGTGVLCSACISNSDCETGALCILRGGEPDASGANGFCATSCTTQSDCPDSFLCTQFGASRQCVPTGNACQ